MPRRPTERPRVPPDENQVADAAETERPEERTQARSEQVARPLEVAGEKREVERERRAEEDEEGQQLRRSMRGASSLIWTSP